MLVTEGVFGMAGDLGNLKAITDLKRSLTFAFWLTMLMVLALWVQLGQIPSILRWDQVDIYFATFAKSMAGIETFVASQEHVIRFWPTTCALKFLQNRFLWQWCWVFRSGSKF